MTFSATEQTACALGITSAVAALLSTKDATFTPGVAGKRGPIAADMPHDANTKQDEPTNSGDDANVPPDPRDTDHPAGEDHARHNQENEPVA